MNTPILSRPTIRFFVGCINSSEIKMHLHHSNLWKEHSLIGLKKLEHATFEQKEYIGCKVLASCISPTKIQEVEKQAKKELKEYCPDLNIDSLSFVLFPEVLIG